MAGARGAHSLRVPDIKEQNMWNTVSRVSAVIGGSLCVAFAVLAAGKPAGCVGDACLLESHRDLGGLNVLVVAGAALILLALAVHARGPSAVAVASGAAVVLAGVAAANWYVLVAGVAACVIGSVLLGIEAVRAGSRWVGALLVAGSLALFAANDQDERVLLLIPFALAWMVAGAYGVGSRLYRSRAHR